jgi:hypothetical protein
LLKVHFFIIAVLFVWYFFLDKIKKKVTARKVSVGFVTGSIYLEHFTLKKLLFLFN